MTFHMLRVPSADRGFELYHILSLVILCMASVDRFDWSIACSAGKSVHGHFLQYGSKKKRKIASFSVPQPSANGGVFISEHFLH